MEQNDHAELVDWANLVPATAMALFWLAPMVLFWGMVFGPLRPINAPRVNHAPTMPTFLLCCGVSLVPRWLPRSYYRERDVERARRRYEALGVRVFKQFVANGDRVSRWARRREPGYRVLAGRDELECFAERTRGVEHSHLVLLLLTAFSAFHAARIGWYGWAIGLTIGNILCNVYPVLLQRYNRARVALIGEALLKRPREKVAAPVTRPHA